jgi:hypothetical protein
VTILTSANRNVLLAGIILICAVGLACSRAEAVEKMPAGTEVTVVTQDGTLVRGKIARVDPEILALSGANGEPATEISRTSIAEVKRVPPGETAPVPVAVARTMTIPDNTRIDVELNSALASDSSRVEQAVRATVATPVVIDEVTVIPTGSTLLGHVTGAEESGKVKGRAELGFRFTRLQVGPVTYDIDTQPFFYRAQSTKKDDAVKIGVGAAAGALVGALTGGKKGAAIGTAIGAGGGTAVVLATDGDEIRLASGRKLKVSLTSPLIIRTK